MTSVCKKWREEAVWLRETSTAWQVGTHPPPPHINAVRAIRFSPTTRSCNTPTLASLSCNSTSRRQDITAWRYSRPDTGLFNNSAGLPPDESASAPIYGKSALIPHPLASTSPAATTTRTPTSRRICSGTHLRSSTATTTTTPSRRHPTAPFWNATPPTNELLRHHIVVEALRVFPTTRSCTHPLTLLQHSPLPASSERALLHWPPSVAALSDTTLRSTPDSRLPRSPLLSVKHTTGECSCTVLQ